MYAALTAVYQPKATRAAAKTAANARSAGSRGGEPRRRVSPARPATTGSTPSPIVSAPAAQSPYSSMRPRSYPVAISHWCECAATAALQTIRPPLASTRERVGREHHRRHQEAVHVLEHAGGGVRVVDPPHRREHVVVERLEPVGVAEHGRPARVRDRALDVRVLELVAEQPRRDVAPGLPGVQEDEPDERGRERHRRDDAVVPPARGDRRRCRRAHSATAPRTTLGSRSVSRRTNRQVTPASVHAPTIKSRSSREACGIVT